MMSLGLCTQIIEIIFGMIFKPFDKYVCRKSALDINLKLRVLLVGSPIKGRLRKAKKFLPARICDV